MLNIDQHQNQKTISTNKSVISKINQQHKPLVDWCYCGRTFLCWKVCCFVVHKFACIENNFFPTEKGNRIRMGKFWQGGCLKDDLH